MLANFLEYTIIRTEGGGKIIGEGTVALPGSISLTYLDCQPNAKLINCLISGTGTELFVVYYQLSPRQTSLGYYGNSQLTKYLDFEPENSIMVGEYVIMQSLSNYDFSTPKQSTRSITDASIPTRNIFFYKLSEEQINKKSRRNEEENYLKFAYKQDTYCKGCTGATEMMNIPTGSTENPLLLFRTKFGRVTAQTITVTGTTIQTTLTIPNNSFNLYDFIMDHPNQFPVEPKSSVQLDVIDNGNVDPNKKKYTVYGRWIGFTILLAVISVAVLWAGCKEMKSKLMNGNRKSGERWWFEDPSQSKSSKNKKNGKRGYIGSMSNIFGTITISEKTGDQTEVETDTETEYKSSNKDSYYNADSYRASPLRFDGSSPTDSNRRINLRQMDVSNRYG